MSKKRDIYSECVSEIIKIGKLSPEWCISNFLLEEDIDVTNAPLLYGALKEYRERLEIDNKMIMDDEETAEIIREGMRIHSLLIKQQMYGED